MDTITAAWEQAIRQHLDRLGCVHDDDPEHEQCIDLTTLWDELFMLGGGGDDRWGERRARDEYAYLQQHGYHAYWAWMQERDDHCGVPWAFFLDGEPTIADRLCFALEQAEAVLACLEALPEAGGVHQVWAALEALPRADEADA